MTTTFSPSSSYINGASNLGAAPANMPIAGPPDPTALPNAGVPTMYAGSSDAGIDPSANYIQAPSSSAMGGASQSGWNSSYATDFLNAFQSAHVNPSTISAAMYTLAANAPTTGELDQALEYLGTPKGQTLAPYLAEKLAKAAPGYESPVSDPGGVGSTGDTTDPTADPSADPTTDPSGSTGADGAPTVVGTDEQGDKVYSDGSVTDAQGKQIAPPGTIDPNTGEVINDPDAGKVMADPSADPNAAADPNADPNAAPTDDSKKSSPIPKILLGGAGLVAGGLGLKYVLNKRNHPATPVDPANPAGGTTPTDPAHPTGGGGGTTPVDPAHPTGGTGGVTPPPTTPTEEGIPKLFNTDGSVDLAAITKYQNAAAERASLPDDIATSSAERKALGTKLYGYGGADGKHVDGLADRAKGIEKSLGELDEKIADQKIITHPTERQQGTLRALEGKKIKLLQEQRVLAPEIEAANKRLGQLTPEIKMLNTREGALIQQLKGAGAPEGVLHPVAVTTPAVAEAVERAGGGTASAAATDAIKGASNDLKVPTALADASEGAGLTAAKDGGGYVAKAFGGLLKFFGTHE